MEYIVLLMLNTNIATTIVDTHVDCERIIQSAKYIDSNVTGSCVQVIKFGKNGVIKR